jgi:hypothetical protein
VAGEKYNLSRSAVLLDLITVTFLHTYLTRPIRHGHRRLIAMAIGVVSLVRRRHEVVDGPG